MKKMRVFFLVAVVGALVAAGCGRHASSLPPVRSADAGSPGAVKPAPMVATKILPSSAMRSAVRKPLSAIGGLSWSQIAGSASQVALAPDGSMWVLSDQPSGADKDIWHYASGTWTNISGAASQIAVRPDGTLYAINSLGAIYSYSGGSWTGIGGSGGSIGAGGDGSIYVTAVGSGDQDLWRYAGVSWSQIAGSGVTIAGSSDAGYYPIGAGTSAQDPILVTNASGGIFVQSTSGGFGQIAGSASRVAPTGVGGLFALSFPAASGGEDLYYYDLSSQNWTREAGAISNVSATSSTVCVVNSIAAIYCSPLSYPTPTPTPSPTATPTPIPPGTVVARYTIPSAGAQPGGIVYAGTVWFTESATNKIGALLGSAFREYAVPTANSVPAAIDNNFGVTWFGEYGSPFGTIAKVDSTGQLTEYQLDAGAPGGIVANQDGTVWVAETNANILEHFGGSFPLQYITPHIPTLAARDGGGINMWVSERDADAVAYMTSAGFTETTLPIGSHPVGITSPGNGTAWFAESGTGKIGLIFGTSLTHYTLPAGIYPMQLASTANGVWFTATNGSVGRILSNGTVSIYNVGATGGSSAPFGNPIAYGGGYIWVGDASTNSILQIHT